MSSLPRAATLAALIFLAAPARGAEPVHPVDPVQAADAARQADVAASGARVMPFDLRATLHVFTKTARGGVQRVVARDAADARQVALVREHLRALRGQFLRGDFTAPEHVHGQAMPGLAALSAAAPGQIDIAYAQVPGGAELRYASADARLVAALHAWFDAQLGDHGGDAMAGHGHAGHEVMPERP